MTFMKKNEKKWFYDNEVDFDAIFEKMKKVMIVMWLFK